MKKSLVAAACVVWLAAILVSFALFGSALQPGEQRPGGETTAAPTASPLAGTPGSQAPTPSPAPSRSPTAQSATPTEPATTAAEPLARRVNETRLGRAIVAEVNRHRASRGVEDLTTYADPVATLDEMARTHADNMARVGRATHVYAGDDSEARYRDASLFYTCKFESDGGGHVVTAEYDRLEVVGKFDADAVAGDAASSDLVDRIAAGVVDQWFGDHFAKQKLRYENARWIGVGVEVVEDDVYVTATLC